MHSTFSKYELQRLAPLLGSVARVIAGGARLAEAELNVLFLAAGIDTDPEVVSEVRRWREMLLALALDPSPERRYATAEGLKIRGQPEEAAEAAVAMVADAALARARRPRVMPLVEQGSVRAEAVAADGNGRAIAVRQPLSSSPAQLDFGALRLGEGAAAELRVRGGPGWVVVDHPDVRANPPLFAGGTCIIRVDLAPPPDDVSSSGLVDLVKKMLHPPELITSLKLVTDTEMMDVPIRAMWLVHQTAGWDVLWRPLAFNLFVSVLIGAVIRIGYSALLLLLSRAVSMDMASTLLFVLLVVPALLAILVVNIVRIFKIASSRMVCVLSAFVSTLGFVAGHLGVDQLLVWLSRLG